MAQGKNKVKAKLPANVKHKSLNKTNKQNSAFQKRKSAPAKQKIKDKQKIQEAITKNVNRKNEDELRSRALSKPQTMSSAQKAVIKHHEKQSQKPENNSMEEDT